MDRKIVRIKPKIYSEILFVLFFCYGVFATVVEEFAESELIAPLYYLTFFVLFLLSLIVKNGKRSLIVPFLVYFVVFLLFLVTALFHPEYDDWFTHSVYGIVPALLSPQSGIWAFLIVWLVNDDNDLYKSLKWTAYILFAFYTMQFILASTRGYWIIWEIDGTLRHDRYSLEFGYNMLLPVAFFGSGWLLQSKKLYFIPYALGTVIIMSSGSRGAVIWPVIMILFLLPFKWKSLEKKKKIWFSLILAVLLIAAIFVYMNYQIILMGISTLLGKYGISSRTLSSLIDGTFTDGNGRERIYAMAMDLIKKGGLFGHGVYGDRYTLGNYFKWGYCHNIFLEFFVSFGYLGGILASVALIVGVLKLYKRCDTVNKQMVFITFLVTACKLILSNSFWYTGGFWALLALILRQTGADRLRAHMGHRE